MSTTKRFLPEAEERNAEILATFRKAEQVGLKLAIKGRLVAIVLVVLWLLWSRGQDPAIEILIVGGTFAVLGLIHFRIISTRWDRPWSKYVFLGLDVAILSTLVAIAPVELDEDRIENGIHVRTGLVDSDGLMLVVNNCTNCHSAKLVTQNRMTAERWNATIKWMQETQNLWDLGRNQEVIVNYLVTNYPPKSIGRRVVLTDIDWYELNE